MRASASQRGISLMEIAFAMIIFAAVVTAVIYGVRVVKQAKVKAFVIQVTQIKSASEMFRQRYGTLPGDFAEARNRLRDCGPAGDQRCDNGNGDQIVSNSFNTNACRLPNYDAGQAVFPCTDVGNNSGNETAQFWRHLVHANLLQSVKVTNRAYQWGDGLPKVRMGGGLQVLYNGNMINDYARNLTGHFLSYQRLPNLLHRDFNSVGDGPIAAYDTQAIDREIDDGLPLTGTMRSTGGWGCGNLGGAPDDQVYANLEMMQCFILFKIDP